MDNDEYKKWKAELFENDLLDEDQLTDAELGEVPYGYVWHHDPLEPGRMMLVPISVHEACKHVGGQKIWGGGNKNR